MSAKIQKICVGLFSGGAALVWLRVCYMAAVSLNETKHFNKINFSGPGASGGFPAFDISDREIVRAA